MNTRQINIRIDESTKKVAEGIFSKLGLAPSDAIRLFYRQVALRRGLPFPVEIPNKETVAAINELDRGGGKRMSLKAFKASLKKGEKRG